ncbi:MAG TPA: DNA-deoxyinosine glycosylase [Thiotrichaceae bacterium]|jgi:hypoxanthine-DNA glycosylase|nr:DNA-deoxyinosine glycosylase [Thiotrichaceae bacterium]HIM07540.1 DNA-deoxyinosine glycosylase [Gammaproteobacteria bacterium]
MTNSIGFPPIVKSDATILILGSMPGQKSLDENQYYAHPRNNFWPIMFQLFNVKNDLVYEQRKQLLLDNKIAVWDVLKSCYREGSLDSDIDNSSIEANDFVSFFENNPKVKAVFFNGAKAEQIFNNEMLHRLQQVEGIEYYKLPSTSPAHAVMTREQKLIEWEIIKQFNEV